jgi:hypothetical protein
MNEIKFQNLYFQRILGNITTKRSIKRTLQTTTLFQN